MFEKRQEDRGMRPQDIFNWNSVPSPDPKDVEMWIGATDAKDRTFPLQIARQVHDEIEWRLMSPTKMDALEMAQSRGAMKAMMRFAQLYQAVLDGKARQ